MTANEMATELELELDRSSSFGSPGYEDFELASVLNKAQELYVKKFIDRKNNRKSESFEETEIRGQGLSALIKRAVTLTVSADQTGVFPNGQYFDLPEDFMYCIQEDVTIDKNVCNTDDPIVASVSIVQHDEVTSYRGNKYKKPYYKNYGSAKIWRLFYSREIDGYDPALTATDKRHQLITDGSFNVTDYTMSYLINPKEIIVDRATPANQRNCTLDESTHLTIIGIAADLMMNRVKEQKMQNIESLKDLE